MPTSHAFGLSKSTICTIFTKLSCSDRARQKMELELDKPEGCTLEPPALCGESVDSKKSENAQSSEDQDLVSLSNELDVLLDPKVCLLHP